MKLKPKIILFFTATIFLTSLIFLIASGFASNYTIQSSVGKYNAIIATKTASTIDRIVYRRIERWSSYVNPNQELVSVINSSNQEFASMSDADRDQIIKKLDQAWIDQSQDSLSPLMQEIIGNSISEDLREKTKFYNTKYGYQIFPEVLVTDKYGLNVAETGRTSDYNQADEEWWQKTKEDGIYVGNIEYDESAKTSAIPIGISIKDSEGNFIGELKVIYNIEDIYDAVSDIKHTSEIEEKNAHESLSSINLFILNRDDEQIYSMNDNQIGLNQSELEQNIAKSASDNYFIVNNDSGQRTFYAYATEEGYKDFKGLGWKVLISYNTSEILAPVTLMGELLVLIFFISLIISVIVSFVLSKRITKPIGQLEADVKEYIAGNFSHKSALKTKDEFGEISLAFNQMTEAIKQSRQEIDRKVNEQTAEIEENAQKIADQQKATMNILEDVEEEKSKTEREKDKINTILHSIGDAVFVVDNDLQIILINEVTSKISGYSQKELIGRVYNEVLNFVFESESAKEKVNDKFIKDAISSGQVQEMSNHTLLIRKDGKKVPVADSAAPLKDKNGKIIGCVVVFRDVTKERQIDQAKTEFVSLASHQLRTPLSAVNWYAEMLLAGDVGKITPDQKKYLEEIYKGNQRMVSLVNALLDVSRIELGTFAVEPKKMQISESAHDIVKEINHDAAKKKIEVKENYETDLPEIMADPKLIQIIIQNLLSNAVKYTPEKGKVSLTITKKDPSILIEVKDSGYGIPDNQKDQIFGKLFRADNVRQKDTEGTGLGLYIVKSIVDHSGGKIHFESTENKGTTFFVELPLKGMPKKEGTKALEDIK